MTARPLILPTCQAQRPNVYLLRGPLVGSSLSGSTKFRASHHPRRRSARWALRGSRPAPGTRT
jgi:hypothetical protein